MIKILLFAGIAEKIGQTQIEADKSEISVEELLHHLADAFPEIEHELQHTLVAVNEEFVERNTILKIQDVVALIPPVSGG